jgi:hypothetical protein
MGDEVTLNVKSPFTSQDDFPPSEMAYLLVLVVKSERCFQMSEPEIDNGTDGISLMTFPP